MGVLKMKKYFLVTILILVTTAIPSFALPILGSNGLEGLGSFSGKFEYDQANFSITVSLTNTSPAANGGFLTAFAFNIPSSDFALIDFGAQGFNFLPLYAPVNASPFDDFDSGAALNNGNLSWLGGGDPKAGIGVGETGTFLFTLSGTGLASINTEAFFSQPDPWFVARFRGFNDGGSDKVPINTNTPVPEPATMLLLSAGLIGLGFFGRKKSLK
jgi:hypothetical protein